MSSGPNAKQHKNPLEETLPAQLDLRTRVAIITGGAGGIGRATCLELARKGIRAVGVVDLSPGVDDFCLDGNKRIGREVLIPYRGDVTEPGFRRSAFADLERRFGTVTVCIPAAGITRDRLAVRINKETGEPDIYNEEEFRRVMAVDLVAPVYWALETIASVARDRHNKGLKKWTPSEGVQGAIIFIGSVSSSGNRGQVAYASAKAGLDGAQATLATEAIFHGVRCAIIHPGYTDTPMVRALGDEFIATRILPFTQLGRLIHPAEIAHAIAFLVCNSAVSGQLWADAGWHPVA